MYFEKMRILSLLIIVLPLLPSCSGQKITKGNMNQKQVESIQGKEHPTYLYKVLSVDDWGKTCKNIHVSKMDTAFIHLSTEEQLDKIIEKYWANTSEYVVLKIKTDKLLGNLVLEANPGGVNKYYHLYKGSIPLAAVIEMKLHIVNY